MPVRPRSKEPLTRNGVKDATCDERTILHWWDRWPDANVGIACGAPGPTVLDIDNLDAGQQVLAQLADAQVPTVATTRGRHLYFRGNERGTIKLDYGELRGAGSYVLAPPSVHPSGKAYVWLAEPNGPLPDVPASIAAERVTAGAGEYQARSRVKHGERHDHLKDVAVRLVRAGITDVPTIERALRTEYESVCDPHPPARTDEFIKLARWAAKTSIAQRERERASDDTEGKVSGGMPTPPGRDATLAEHRAYLAAAGGWQPIDIAEVIRTGTRAIDSLEVRLTNGLVIEFPHQGDITTRGIWDRTVRLETNGIADPPQLKGWELGKVLNSLCILASAPPEIREAEELSDLFADFLALTEPVLGHTVTETVDCFKLIEAVRARAVWNPRDQGPNRPALIVDRETSLEYVRAGELRDYLNFRGAGIAMSAMAGRMRRIGLARVDVNGREPADTDRTGVARQKAHIRLYRIEP